MALSIITFGTFLKFWSIYEILESLIFLHYIQNILGIINNFRTGMVNILIYFVPTLIIKNENCTKLQISRIEQELKYNKN